MNRQTARQFLQRGFTLIEVMVVVTIFGVLAALAAPTFQQAYDRSNFRSGEHMVMSSLKKARSYAVGNKVPFGVYFGSDSRVVTVFENTTNPTVAEYDATDSVYAVDTLSDDFAYVNTDLDNGAILFQPNGSALASGNIILIAETADLLAYSNISILASTGRVSSYSHFYNW